MTEVSETTISLTVTLEAPGPLRSEYRVAGTSAWIAGPDETSSSYDTHAQTITGLTAGTDYQLRVVAYGPEGIDVFDLGDVTTTGDTVTPPPPTPGYGPRPAPAFPTTNVYVAPASIPHQNGLVSGTGADSYPALQAWLDDLPDDCIAIFDSSLGGGTTYSLSHYLRINGQRGITFWGFHTRINMTQAGAYQYHGFDVSGGAERCTFRGFHIVGRNAAGGTFGAFGGSSEHNHGITLGAWCRDITIAVQDRALLR